MSRNPQLYQKIQHLASGGPMGLVTQSLLLINAVWFIYMTVAGVSLTRPDPLLLARFGALFGPFVYQGEIWRLLSCQFVHIGLIHLGFNMYVLFAFGKDLEVIYGPWHFLWVYLFAGTCGAMASLWAHPVGLSAGASGAIFGLAGAALAFYLQLRDTTLKSLFVRWRNSLLMFVGYNALFGMIVPGIDNWAHFGGLLGGFLMGLITGVGDKDNPQSWFRLFLGLGVGLGSLYAIGMGLGVPLLDAMR